MVWVDMNYCLPLLNLNVSTKLASAVEVKDNFASVNVILNL